LQLQSLLEEWKRIEHKLRYLNALNRIFAGICLIGAAYLGFMFPAASIPALTAAGFARFSSRTMPESYTHGRVLGWAIAGGAGGYALFAALGIDVPAPDAPLVWRVFGGLVFGAVAGVAAWLVVSYMSIYLKPPIYLSESLSNPNTRPRLRPLVRWIAGILGVASVIVGATCLFVGATTVQSEGFGNLQAWKHSLLFFVVCVPIVWVARIFLQAAWTGANPSLFDTLDRGIGGRSA
jgi:hypothetical protein